MNIICTKFVTYFNLWLVLSYTPKFYFSLLTTMSFNIKHKSGNILYTNVCNIAYRKLDDIIYTEVSNIIYITVDDIIYSKVMQIILTWSPKHSCQAHFRHVKFWYYRLYLMLYLSNSNVILQSKKITFILWVEECGLFRYGGSVTKSHIESWYVMCVLDNLK